MASHQSHEEVRIPSFDSSCILWNSEKVSQYCSQGIICSAIGTLPQTPQQSSVLGAPFSVPRQAIFSEKLVESLLESTEDQETLHEFSSRSASYNALRSSGLIPVDGLKLGVDWLAYRNDPLSIHSEALVTSVSSSSFVTANELTSLNRLAAAVNKKAFVAVHFDNLESSSLFCGIRSHSAIKTCLSLIPVGTKLVLVDVQRVNDLSETPSTNDTDENA